MRRHHLTLSMTFGLGLGLTAMTLSGCGDPCLDDGAGRPGAACEPVASGTGSETATETSDSDSESMSMGSETSDSMSMGTMDTETTGDPDENWCLDEDGDGFGDPDSCEPVPEGEDPPAGSVPEDQATDCDDDDANTFPGAAEIEDANACMTDADDDGWGDEMPSNPNAIPGSDCDDANAQAFPGAAENEDPPDACMEDSDEDGWGDIDPMGEATTPGTDCDDDDPLVLMCEIWCPDLDMDGFGDPEGCVPVPPGEDPPAGTVMDNTDCDDSDPFTFVGAAELDDPDACMTDADEDGWGEMMPGDGVSVGRDCDDTDSLRVVCVDAIPACAATDGNMPSTQLMATATGGDGNYVFSWDNADTLDDADIADPVATPLDITTYTVTATDGLLNAGNDKVTVHVDDPWVLGGVQDAECEAVGFLGPAALHNFSQDGSQTCTTSNSDPTAFICPTVHEQALITGTMIVTDDDGDDDIIGFVWGWQSDQQFYMFQWKKAYQNWFGCDGLAGMMVKKFDAQGNYVNADFACSTDSPNAEVLLLPADIYEQGWVEGVEYGVEVAYDQAQTEITITDLDNNIEIANFIVMDDSYPSGQFGTYDFSQINACNGPWQSSCL